MGYKGMSQIRCHVRFAKLNVLSTSADATDGGEELFTRIHYVRIINFRRFYKNLMNDHSASW